MFSGLIRPPQDFVLLFVSYNFSLYRLLQNIVADMHCKLTGHAFVSNNVVDLALLQEWTKVSPHWAPSSK
jgi:hypothetical protein